MTAQCRYRHCRRFIRSFQLYCGGLHLCQIYEEDRLAMSEGAIRAMQKALRGN